MSSAAQLKLPLSLLDLTTVQAREQLAMQASHSDPLFCRRVHALALKTRLPPDVRGGYLRPSSAARDAEYVQLAHRAIERRRRETSVAKEVCRPVSRTSTPRAAALLRNRVEALVSRPLPELSIRDTQESEAEAAIVHYSNDQLQEMYADLLAHPESEIEVQAEVNSEIEAAQLLEAVARRMTVTSDPSSSTSPSAFLPLSSLASRLYARRVTSDLVGGTATSDPLVTPPRQLDPQNMHHSILLRLTDVLQDVDGARIVVGSSSIPIVLLTLSEWAALVHTCIDQNELDTAEYSLQLMKRFEMELPENLVNDLMAVHALRGDVSTLVSLFDKFSIDRPTERQRDLHIKAYLMSSSPEYDIHSALNTLHNYESLALLPPVRSYTRLICALFSTRSAQLQAQAWDLFAHMRYVAHAKPDAQLYVLMIRACAGTGYSQSGYAADPARALDLWTEMTTEASYEPTVGAYNAVILACARSSDYAADAFRLAREMLDAHRDAYGNPLMHATQETFNALLVAAKARKDLSRARWILAEMLKIYDQGVREGREIGVAPDAQTVMHVFHAYASYRPPFRRSETTIIDESKLIAAVKTSTDEHSASRKEVEKVSEMKRRFGVAPPQTRSEVLAESNILFERILEDTGRGPNSPVTEALDTSTRGPFSRVTVGATVLNSYLSVYYMHGSLEESRRLYDEVFRSTGIERTARTYIEALERCAKAEPGDEREIARSFADDIWSEWLKAEKTLQPKSTDARLIERAYAAMIRVSSLVGDLDRAMHLVRDFATRYTPREVSTPSQKQKPAMRSTRTSLFAARPIVRLTTPSEVQDDTVPPLLTLRDLELLHQRLVVVGPKRRTDLDYLTYLGHAYMGALRKRRDLTIRA